MASAIFTAPNGQPAAISIRRELHALTVVSVGDLLHVGSVFKSRILARTAQGIDVNGAPFAPYSVKGPIYFSPNRESAGGNRKAMATAAKNRHEKTGRIGIRTATGIKYESYAAMKAALGRSGVDLFGAGQHPHMLNAIMVQCGGMSIGGPGAGDFGSELGAFESNTPAKSLQVGFYGPEAERARGNNEGTSTVPKREFFALNPEDLQIAERAIAQRMIIRAKSGHAGPGSGGPMAVSYVSGPVTLEDVPF